MQSPTRIVAEVHITAVKLTGAQVVELCELAASAVVCIAFMVGILRLHVYDLLKKVDTGGTTTRPQCGCTK